MNHDLTEDEADLTEEEIEIEEKLVMLELDHVKPSTSDKLDIKFIGLDKDKPLLFFNGGSYQGKWEEPFGTYMYFEKNLGQTFDPVYEEPSLDAYRYKYSSNKLLKMSTCVIVPKNELTKEITSFAGRKKKSTILNEPEESCSDEDIDELYFNISAEPIRDALRPGDFIQEQQPSTSNELKKKTTKEVKKNTAKTIENKNEDVSRENKVDLTSNNVAKMEIVTEDSSNSNQIIKMENGDSMDYSELESESQIYDSENAPDENSAMDYDTTGDVSNVESDTHSTSNLNTTSTRNGVSVEKNNSTINENSVLYSMLQNDSTADYESSILTNTTTQHESSMLNDSTTQNEASLLNNSSTQYQSSVLNDSNTQYEPSMLNDSTTQYESSMLTSPPPVDVDSSEEVDADSILLRAENLLSHIKQEADSLNQ